MLKDVDEIMDFPEHLKLPTTAAIEALRESNPELFKKREKSIKHKPKRTRKIELD